MNISLAVIALNEEDRIKRCLDSVPFATEKLVVDSGSTDGTASVARSCGARVLQRAFTTFSEQKQFAVDSCGGDWILLLDADECLSSELSDAIQKTLQSGTLGAYRVRRRVLYLGRLLRFGPWSGETVLRLFPRGSAVFNKASVHEKLIPSVEVAVINTGWIEHNSYRSLSEHAAVMNRYCNLWAEEQYGNGIRSGIMKTALRTSWRFLSAFILRGGFLEGYHGFLASVMSAGTVFLKWSLLLEKHCRK